MTFKAFRSQAFSFTHENIIFDHLLEDMELTWGESEETVYLLGNFNCNGREIDGAVLKKDNVIILDFKDYGGEIKFSENDSWIADGAHVKGGASKNPYRQIQKNRLAMIDFLTETPHLAHIKKNNWRHSSAVVLFHQPITFDDYQIPGNIRRWFHVSDRQRVMARLDAITSKEINLEASDLYAIIKTLEIEPYTPLRSHIPLDPEADPSDDNKLPAQLDGPQYRLEEFLKSEDRVCIISGMVGTGKESLAKHAFSIAAREGKNTKALWPNARSIKDKAGTSIYSHIFSSEPNSEGGILVFPIKKDNEDDENMIYVVQEAHLIADTKYEIDNRRYGSGQLLSDFIKFVDLKNRKNKILFIGDPYQLGRGKVEESALAVARVESLTSFVPKRIPLNVVLEENGNNSFIKQNSQIANALRQNRFNNLVINVDSETIFTGPRDNEQKEDLISKLLKSNPLQKKILAFSNLQTQKINSWVRQKLFNRGANVERGDILHILHGVGFRKKSDNCRQEVFPDEPVIKTDCFGEVTCIHEELAPISQQLQGRAEPTVVQLIKIDVKISEKVFEFTAFKDFLYAEKPELAPDLQIAVQADAKKRFQTARGPLPEKKTKERKVYDKAFTNFMREDRIVNAARVRFGYAITVHRAQGHKFEHVLVNMDMGEGQSNAEYFRWLYTIFTTPKHRLTATNVPHITPFSNASWDDSNAILNTSKTPAKITYEHDPGELKELEGHEFAYAPLQALYTHIRSKAAEIDIEVVDITSHNYQEIYTLKNASQENCKIKFIYNKNFQVSNCEIVASKGSENTELGKVLMSHLTSKINIESSFQQLLFDSLEEWLHDSLIKITGLEHQSFQEIYYLSDGQDTAKLRLYYKKDEFVSHISLMSYSSPSFREKVRINIQKQLS